MSSFEVFNILYVSHSNRHVIIFTYAFNIYFSTNWTSLVAQLVKILPTMQETWVQPLGREDSPGEGKGCPLQYSRLENSMDCTVHGVVKSWTQLSNFHFLYQLMMFNIFSFAY